MPQQFPKISVIVPVYKAEETLDACVNSILAQTLDDFELLLIDDESPDRCPELCDAWAAREAHGMPNSGKESLCCTSRAW